MNKKNAFYAQSGGVTAVINASAQGVIETAAKHRSKISKVYAGHNGIIGALQEELIDTSKESKSAIANLIYTPGGAFGSCRYKLGDIKTHQKEYERLIEVFAAHNIAYFFYNGGGDSQDTAYKVAKISQAMNYPIQCIGIPKTIDNDLPYTDTCPGFGSVAKYVAIATLEASLDVASMATSSTKVFILEVMGRHAGWIAASSALASDEKNGPPHIILLPEVPFDEKAFLQKVDRTVKQCGYCTVVVSEGLRNHEGAFLSEMGSTDAFGHKQLGGVAPVIANLVKSKLQYKYHWAVADYLQRSARHIASKVDVEQAYALGKAAVELAIKGKSGIMPYIKRIANKPYRWRIETIPLQKVANVEKALPKKFIAKDGMQVTQACRNYLEPLIQGELPPKFKHGIPQYTVLKKTLVKKKLHQEFEIK